MEVDPNGDWILVNQAINDHVRDDDGSVLIYKPDATVDATQYAEIVDVGPKCRYIRKENCNGRSFLVCPALSNYLKEWKPDEAMDQKLYFIREKLIMDDKANRAYIIEV